MIQCFNSTQDLAPKIAQTGLRTLHRISGRHRSLQVFTSGLQQSLSGLGRKLTDESMRLRWIRFQVVHLFSRPGFNPHDELEAGIANPEKPRGAPALGAEVIRATVSALNALGNDRVIRPTNRLLPAPPPHPPP